MSSNSSNSGKNILHSGTTHPELVCNSRELQLKGTAPKRLSSFHKPATSEVPEPNTLLTKWIQFGGFYGPFWFGSLLGSPIELRKVRYL